MSLYAIPRSCGRRSARSVQKLLQNRISAPSNSIARLQIASLHSDTKKDSAATQTIVPDSSFPIPSSFPRGITKPAETYRREAAPLGTQLEWDQVAPGRFERAVDAMERFYGLQESVAAHHGVHNWMMSNGIKIHSDRRNLAEDVKNTWIALRHQFPALSSQIEGDRWVYTVPDEAELEQWVSETFFIHDSNMTSRQMFSELETRPLKRGVLHFLPRTQEVIFQSPHTHMDGVGVVTFFDAFMKELTNPTTYTFGNEGSNLLPALTPMAHIPKFSPSQKSRWDANIRDWLSDHPTVKLETETADKPGKSTMQWLRFTPEDTQKLLKACKDHKVTVSSAGQAAVTHAARIHGNCEHVQSCATLALYDAREYVSPKVPRSKLVGPHTFATPVKIRLGSFLETAKNAREVFVREKEDKYALAMSPYYTTEFPRLLHTPPPPGKARPMPSNAHMSSVGKLDALLASKYTGTAGAVGLSDMWMTLDIMTPDVLIAMWTIGGRLIIQADYNEAYHPTANVEKFLALIKQQFVDGLEIDVNPELMKPGMEGYLQRGGFAKLHRTHESKLDGGPCIEAGK